MTSCPLCLVIRLSTKCHHGHGSRAHVLLIRGCGFDFHSIQNFFVLENTFLHNIQNHVLYHVSQGGASLLMRQKLLKKDAKLCCPGAK